MRTTIDLPDELMKQVKVAAAQDGVNLRTYIKTAIEGRLRVAESRKTRPTIVTIPPGNRQMTLVNSDDAVFGTIEDYLS